MINAKRVNSDSSNIEVQVELTGKNEEIVVEAAAILRKIGEEQPIIFLAVISKALEILANQHHKGLKCTKKSL